MGFVERLRINDKALVVYTSRQHDPFRNTPP
ncbi:protein of unknown function [Thauera humireducens]|nr:protein of unknown function [Thauera humireducens]